MTERRRWASLLLAIVALLGIAVVGFLLWSPRHRQFYSWLLVHVPQTNPAQPLLSRPPAPPPPAPRAPTPPEQTKPEASPGARAARSGTGERVVVKVADTLPAGLPSAALPSGWILKEFVGRAQVEVVRDDSRPAFHLISHGTSFALSRDVALDLKQFPTLVWRWKVMKLPSGGDVRERTRDDQAIQVYLIFPRWPDPRINSDVVGYVWDSRAPVGTTLTSTQSPNVKLIVLQSGSERLGRWVQEERNAYRDYVDLFNKEPPRIGLVALMADSNDTQSEAEALVEDLVFLRPQGPSTGQP